MISYDEALRRVVDAISPLPPVEAPLQESAGLVLAAPAQACWGMPRCDNSAMDGFAIRGEPQAMATGLSIIGASYAGQPFAGAVQAGEAVRITTGAALPEGVDTVVPIEDVEKKGGQVFLNQRPKRGQHVRYADKEYRSGEILLTAGVCLRAGEVALLASAGVERVTVCPRLQVAVISTGDELVELGQAPGHGQIINSNLHFLKTRLLECGCMPICLGIGADDQKTLDQLIEQALEADLIITTGGVSVGDKDHVQATLGRRHFEKVFWKVAIKPGKPVLFCKIAGKPFFGLPGNPAATAATFELFVRPALKRLAGHTEVLLERRRAILLNEVAGDPKRQAFLWCRLIWEDDAYKVTVSPRQASGQNQCLRGANALLPFPPGVRPLVEGQLVEVLLLDD